MRKIDFSNANLGQEWSSTSAEHVQNALIECIDMLIKGIINYTSNDIVKLHGCVVSVTGSDFSMTAGAIYRNGEVFLVDSFSGTAPGGQTAVWKILTTNEGSAVRFGDLAFRHVHNIRKMGLVFGASGTELGNYNASIVKTIDSLVGARHTHSISNVTGLQAALDDLDANKAEILTISYTAITNPAANTSGSVTYFLDSLGFVHLSGSVTVSDTGVADGNLLVGTLPTGVRPPSTTQYVWFLDTQISIASSGEIRVQRLASDTVVYNFRTIAPFPGT